MPKRHATQPHSQPHSQPQSLNAPRRELLKSTGALTLLSLAASAGLLAPSIGFAQEWNKLAFDTKSLADLTKALGGAAPVESKDIVITTPEIAENGALVPFAVLSKIAGTEQIALLVEKNPNILAAQFSIPDGTDASVSTRVKMGQSSNVFALVKAQGKYYFAQREVKVTLGGCGG